MRIALAQLSPLVGDVAGNTRLVLEAMDAARADGADVVVCPEHVLLGYPPRDLLLRDGVVEACEDAVRIIAAAATDLAIIVGHPRRAAGGVRGLRNSASVCDDGGVVAVADKRLLPGYDIFDEDRYFDPGDGPCVAEIGGVRVGVAICEDLWRAGDVLAHPDYVADPVGDLVGAGAEVIVALNASPFIVGKHVRHLEQLRETARRWRRPIVAVNQVGAYDDLVFDGRSGAVGADGTIRAVLPAWRPATETVTLAPGAATDAGEARDAAPGQPEPDDLHDLFHALALGVRAYVHGTGHERVLVGLSGGIDSAVTAVIAAAAIGPDAVGGVTMPSRYTTNISNDDARALADALGLRDFECLPIADAHETMRRTLTVALPGGPAGLADENIQARLRGVMLMALANARGALLLTTSNKSELAVGYATLYGDMCGALSVLGDVTKTRVYALARWINRHHAALGFAAPPIPERTITRPPTAELRPDQTDQDSLPSYDVLDPIVEGHVEHERAAEDIAAEHGLDPDLVDRLARQIDAAEHKRHQATIILKVTPRTFGRGRPMPIVMRSTTVTPPVPAPEPATRAT